VSYLSIVFVGSNAEYGGDFLGRMQNCVNNLFRLAEKYKLDSDLTLVEWNPPPNRPRMAKAIDWSRVTIPVKIITVPKETHESLPNPHGEKFFEYIAKNVGIRRAAGKFVLSTNPDNVYSEELIARLARHDLEEDCFYRVNRSDTRDGKVIATHYSDKSIVNGKQVSWGASPDTDGTFDYPTLGRLPILHFNASGDFILMAKKRWEEIKGHPEVPYSLTVDGQTLYLAARNSQKQVILSEPMYHADHSRSDKFCPVWDDRKPFGTKNEYNWGLGNAVAVY